VAKFDKDQIAKAVDYAIEHFYEPEPVAEIARKFGVPYRSVSNRLRQRGYDLQSRANDIRSHNTLESLNRLWPEIKEDLDDTIGVLAIARKYRISAKKIKEFAISQGYDWDARRLRMFKFSWIDRKIKDAELDDSRIYRKTDMPNELTLPKRSILNIPWV
jgi:hypothetical protein